MKKILVVFCVFICIFICSCTSKKCFISNVDNQLNYNNISNFSGPWIYEKSFYTSYGDNVLSFYKYDKNGRKILDAFCQGPSGVIQVYEDKILLVDDSTENESDDSCRLRVISRKDNAVIVSRFLENRDCTEFIFNNKVFVLSGVSTFDCRGVLECFSMSNDCKETDLIAENVMSVGVSAGKVLFISTTDSYIEINSYDTKTGEIKSISKFELKLSEEEKLSCEVNYTSNYVIFRVSDYESTYSKIIKFNLKTYEVKEQKFSQYIQSMIAFENLLFYIVVENDGESKEGNFWQSKDMVCSVYKLKLENNEITKIFKSNGDLNITVTSDDYCYIFGSSEGDLLYDGKDLVPIWD